MHIPDSGGSTGELPSHTVSKRNILFQQIALVAVCLLIFLIGLVCSMWIIGRSIVAQRSNTQHDLLIDQNGSVLGEVLQANETVQRKGTRLLVNVPAEFREDVTVNGQTLLYQLLQGEGIALDSADGIVEITNADPGSGQSIFKSIRIGDTIYTADSNNAELILAGTEDLTVTLDQDGRVLFSLSEEIDLEAQSTTNSFFETVQEITQLTVVEQTIIEETTVIEDDDGITDTGDVIVLEAQSDAVALGTSQAEGKLTIESTTSDQVGLVVLADQGQTANLSEWRDQSGETVVSFDTSGNATFGGKVTTTDFLTNDNELTFSGDASNVVFDIKTGEPDNILINPGLEQNLTAWESSLPSGINQTNNPGFETNLNQWDSTVPDGSYSQEFTNTGFEVNTDDWVIDLGDTLTILEQTLPTGASPRGITTGPDGAVWFTIRDTDQIGRMTSDMVITEYDLPAGQEAPNDIVLGSDGRLWYTLFDTGQIGTLDPSAGNKTAIEASMSVYSISASNSAPNRITTGPNGNIWYTEYQGRRIRKVDPGSGSLLATILNDNGLFTWHSDIISGPDGNVWAVESNNDQLIRIDPVTAAYDVMDIPFDFDHIEPGDDNLLYIFSSNQFRAFIFSVDPFAGTSAEIIASVTEVAEAPYPSEAKDMIIGPGGKWWMPVGRDNRIVRWETDFSSNTTFTTPTTGSLPHRIVEGADSNIYVTLPAVNRIAKIVLNQPERVTSPTHNFTNGALEVNATNNITITQNKTLLSSTQYTLETYVYIDGSTAVTTNDAQLYVNGNTIATTITSAGSGWYRLSGTVNGSGVGVSYGLMVKANAHVYVDTFSLRRNAGAFHTFGQFYTSFGSAKIDAPPASDAHLTQEIPFLDNTYGISAHVYTNGSPVTAADANLRFNGAPIATTISSTSKSGWYKLTGMVDTPEQLTDYGVTIKAGRTAYFDDVSALVGSFDATVSHTSQSPFEGTGAVIINAIGTTDINLYQNYMVSEENDYILYTYLYNNTPGSEGGAITTNDAVLTINGNPTAQTTFNAVGQGWYQAIAPEFTLSPGTYQVGVRVSSGLRLRADSFVFQEGTGANKTLSITNTGSGLAYLNVESTTTISTGKATEEGLIIIGSASQEENLMEWQNSNLDILGVIDKAGNVGIGTETPSQGLTVIDDQANTAAAVVVNTNPTDTSTVEVLRLSTGANAVGTDTRFASFYAGATDETDGTLVGKIRLNNNSVSYDTSSADFGEYFASVGRSEEYEPGTVMVLNTSGKVDTTVQSYHTSPVGVVSDTAGFVGNAKPEAEMEGSRYALVGLLGQIDTKVSTINGMIRAGDTITTSMLEGYGMKADRSGMVIGVAMEDFDTERAIECSPVSYGSDIFGIQPALSSATEEASLASESGLLQDPDTRIDGVASSEADIATGQSQASSEADIATGQSQASPEAALSGATNEILCGTVLVYVNTAWRGSGNLADSQDSVFTGLGFDQSGSSITGSSIIGDYNSTFSLSDQFTQNYGVPDTASDSATITSGLTVTGPVNMYDLAVTNSLNAGLLTINGLHTSNSGSELSASNDNTVSNTPGSINEPSGASIDTITGALLLQSQAAGTIEIMGGRTVIDRIGGLLLKEGDIKLRQGVLRGNATFAGTVTLQAQEESLRVEQQWDEVPISIVLSSSIPSIPGAVQDLDENGFSIVTGDTGNQEEVTFYWLAVFGNDE